MPWGNVFKTGGCHQMIVRSLKDSKIGWKEDGPEAHYSNHILLYDVSNEGIHGSEQEQLCGCYLHAPDLYIGPPTRYSLTSTRQRGAIARTLPASTSSLARQSKSRSTLPQAAATHCAPTDSCRFMRTMTAGDGPPNH